MENNQFGNCGCGKPVRYVTTTGGACNKYARCPTYKELTEAHSKAMTLILAYRKKRENDGLNGREWDAEKHHEAEAFIERIERELTQTNEE